MHPLDKEGLSYLTENGDGPFYLMNGESFAIENVPTGTRVLYARPPLPNVGDLRAAVRKALDNPIGMDPLRALLKPGMKVTIAFDDISLALPLMKAPDCRQIALEVVLDYLAQAGVDDFHLVVAVALHRHMHDHEVRYQCGRKIFNAYWHKKKLYNYDAEDKDDNIVLGHTESGHIVEIHKRSATSDLLIYVNLNLIAPDGTLTRKILKAYDPVTVTAEEKAASVEGASPQIKFDFPEHHPPFLRFIHDEAGRLYVQTYEKAGGNNSYVHDVFDPEGRFIARIPLKRVPVLFRGGRLYSLEESEEGYPVIKRYRVIEASPASAGRRPD